MKYLKIKIYLLFVLLNCTLAFIQYHLFCEQTIFGRVHSGLPSYTQLGNLTTRHTGAQFRHFTANSAIVEFVNLETPVSIKMLEHIF